MGIDTWVFLGGLGGSESEGGKQGVRVPPAGSAGEPGCSHPAVRARHTHPLQTHPNTDKLTNQGFLKRMIWSRSFIEMVTLVVICLCKHGRILLSQGRRPPTGAVAAGRHQLQRQGSSLFSLSNTESPPTAGDTLPYFPRLKLFQHWLRKIFGVVHCSALCSINIYLNGAVSSNEE